MEQSSKWLTQDGPGGVQVVPIDDIIIHTKNASCPCAPRVEKHGFTHCCEKVLFIRKVFVHNAMDGRT